MLRKLLEQACFQPKTFGLSRICHLNRGRVQAFAVECGHLGHGGVNHETNITLAAVGARGVLQYDLACYLALSKTEGGKIAPCMQITFTLREVSKERGLDLTRGRELES
jgi:hypothetical protein